MEVKHIKNNNNKDFYFLVDGSGKIVEEVYRYILYLARNGKSKNTYKNYCHHLKIYYEWLDIKGYTYLDVINCENGMGILDNFGDFISWLKFPDKYSSVVPINGYEAKRENSTINGIMSTVSSFYDYLEMNYNIPKFNTYRELRKNSQSSSFLSEMQIKHTPVYQNMLHQKEPKKKLKYITRTEYEKCFNLCSSRRDKLIFALMFEGALRISEICGLMLSDISMIFKNQINIVSRDYTPESPDAFCKYCSEGTVFVPQYVSDLMIEYLNNDLVDVDTNYVFINFFGTNKHKPMRKDTIEDLFERIGKKANIKHLHPHMLRHGCAVDMLSVLNTCSPDQTMNVMVQIKEKLRHKNISTTSDIYAEFNTQGKQAAMEQYYQALNIKFSTDDYNMDSLAEMLIGKDD